MATEAVHGQPQLEQQHDTTTSRGNHGSAIKQPVSDGAQKQQLGLRERIAAAIVAAAASACVVNPLDVVKVRMQALASQAAVTPLQLLQHQPGCYHHSTQVRSLRDARYHYNGINHFISKVMGSSSQFQSSSLMHCACSTAGSHNSTGVLSWDWSELQHSNNEYSRLRYKGASHPASHQLRPLGIVGTTRQIVQQEGLYSLWRGLDSALLMSIPTVLLYYPLYDIMLDKLRNGPTAVNTSNSAMYHVSPMISGVVARATTALVVAPFEFVRTRQQAGSLLSAHAGGQSTWQTLRASLLKGGSADVQLSGSAVLRALPTLWTGLAPTIARDVPFSAIYWGMVEPIREGLTTIMTRNNKQPQSASPRHQQHSTTDASRNQPYSTHHPSDSPLDNVIHPTDNTLAKGVDKQYPHSIHSRYPSAAVGQYNTNQTRVETVEGSAVSPSYGQLVLSNMLAGSIAGASAAAITTPFDVVKTNMQLAHTNDRSMMSVLQSVYQQQGMKGLFVGVGPRAVRCAPACAIVISCYEVLKTMLGSSA